MEPVVIHAKPLSDFKLHLRFEDGHEGVVDIAKLIPFEGVFAKLQDKTYFDQVRVDPELGTICWANGADLAPDALYQALQSE